MAALARIREMRPELEAITPTNDVEFNLALQDWHDLRSALLTASQSALAAINRTESGGAHNARTTRKSILRNPITSVCSSTEMVALVSDYLSVGRAA